MSMLACSQRINHPLRFLRHGLETIHDNLLGLHLQHLAHYDPSSFPRFDDWRSDCAALSIRRIRTYFPFIQGCCLPMHTGFEQPSFNCAYRPCSFSSMLSLIPYCKAGTLRFIMDESSTSVDVVVVSESHVCCKGLTATLGMRKKMVIENQMRRTGRV